MPTPGILVVDGEALLQMLASVNFEKAATEVVEAATSVQAIKIEARPDIHAGCNRGSEARASGVPELRHIAASGHIHPDEADLASGVASCP